MKKDEIIEILDCAWKVSATFESGFIQLSLVKYLSDIVKINVNDIFCFDGIDYQVKGLYHGMKLLIKAFEPIQETKQDIGLNVYQGE